MKIMALTALGMLALLAPPSGRPPIGPLERYEPKLYDLRFDVMLNTLIQPRANDRQSYDLTNAPIVMPVIFLSTFSKVHSDSVIGHLWLDNRDLKPALELKEGNPFNTHLAVMNIDRFRGQSLRWQIEYRTQVWSSRLNEEKAQQLRWPREWPDEVKDGLLPQKYIESDDPMFADAVKRVTNDRSRMVPPYLVAKELVRYCINQTQTNGDGIDRAERGEMRGMEINGAKVAGTSGIGTPHDLVCICVAMLRAAGIPARPIIGVEEDEKARATFVTWAEFYLPECGWIPFDPYVMRGKGIRTMDSTRAWPEFGTLDDLNTRIPLSYHFMPAATVESPQRAAVWGWDPRPQRDPGSEQHIMINITSRGKGVEDPQ